GAYGTHSNYGEGKDKKKAPGHPLDPVLNDTKKLLSEYADERIVMAKAGIKTATEAKPPEQYTDEQKEQYRKAMDTVRMGFERELKFFTELKETIAKMK